MQPVMGFSQLLQRRVRLGSWEDQKISTYSKVLRAVDAERWDDVASLADYFLEEAGVCWHLYRQWLADLEGFLRDEGIYESDLGSIRARLAGLTALPGGKPFDSAEQWERLQRLIARVRAAAAVRESAQAAEAMHEAKELWRQTHDRDADMIYSYMSETAERLGEDAIPRMFERVLLPLFGWRYQRFDIDQHPWDEGLESLLYVACEAMRGHLAGPERTGDFELVELADRFVLSFDPCGSGGRTLRGDPIEGTPARMEPPYNLRVSTIERDWNHYTKGVCLYCAHCIVLMEHMPIDQFGYPLRVVDPPIYADTNEDMNRSQVCSWTMFKDPKGVPEEFYTRTGRSKSTAFGSQAMKSASQNRRPSTRKQGDARISE